VEYVVPGLASNPPGVSEPPNTVPRAGNLTVEVTPADRSAGEPNLEICCVSGNEIYGNPLTLAVGGDSESTVKIGLRRGSAEAESFVVKTSLRTN